MTRMLPLLFAALLAAMAAVPEKSVTIYPAPPGEELSTAYTVAVNGASVPVYEAKVAPADRERRWKAMDDKANSALYFEKAAFAYFDMRSPVDVEITCPQLIREAKVLPSSAGIRPRLEDNRLSFRLRQPRHLAVEINGDWVGSLHLFANPPETDAPSPNDPNVIYFGPGIHEVTHVRVRSGQTVYIAGGAVVRGVIGPGEPFSISGYSGLKTYAPTFELAGDNIRFRGRGILDGGRSTTHARNLLFVRGSNITLEGVILRDSSTWNVPVRQSRNVVVRNLKVLGYRANSDGIDICNSQDVLVEGCFLRTLDDLVVIKTDKGQGPVRNVLVRGCVLWNEVAHALSVGAELREDVDGVTFRDCDIIRDKGREWTLRVYHCDSARVSNIRFENLRIEESPRLISLWIDKAFWSRDEERGHIQGVTFRNITATCSPLVVELKGYDAEHLVQDVEFRNVRVNGRPLREQDIKKNEFVRGVTVSR